LHLVLATQHDFLFRERHPALYLRGDSVVVQDRTFSELLAEVISNGEALHR
jgi:hypothetical protein